VLHGVAGDELNGGITVRPSMIRLKPDTTGISDADTVDNIGSVRL
jgi:hypothetical protein